MNLCKIIGHRWKRYLEDIPSEIKLPGFPPGNFIVNKCEVRMCKRCFKKQKSKINKYYPSGPSDYWVDCEYTIKEKRDMILKKLLD